MNLFLVQKLQAALGCVYYNIMIDVSWDWLLYKLLYLNKKKKTNPLYELIEEMSVTRLIRIARCISVTWNAFVSPVVIDRSPHDHRPPNDGYYLTHVNPNTEHIIPATTTLFCTFLFFPPGANSGLLKIPNRKNNTAKMWVELFGTVWCLEKFKLLVLLATQNNVVLSQYCIQYGGWKKIAENRYVQSAGVSTVHL